MTHHAAHGDSAKADIAQGDIAKVWDMIKDIDVAMLTSHDGDHLRARPMWTLKSDGFDGTLYFFTPRDSHKLAELTDNPSVGLTYAEPKSQDYVSVSCRAGLVEDRDLMGRLWKEPLRTWFPKGLEDPNLALLAVRAEGAEYWDSPSSAMVHLYGYAKAVLTGTPPRPGDHGTVGTATGTGQRL